MEHTAPLEAEVKEAAPLAKAAFKPAAEIPRQTISIQGKSSSFTPSFWRLAIPSLGLRYWPRDILESFSITDHVRKGMEKFITTGSDGKPQGFISKAAKALPDYLYPLATGAIMVGITLNFASKTWSDIKSLYSESVAFEKGKKPEEVNFRDIFSSKNTLVKSTVQDFMSFNARRLGVETVFFLPWKTLVNAVGSIFGTKPIRDTAKIDAVDLGVGAMNLYLLNDILTRKERSFETLQSMVDEKINHNTNAVNSVITTDDVLLIFRNHKAYVDKNYKAPPLASLEWQADKELAMRTVDLLNQTYHNIPNTENANLTIGTLVYLVGECLLDDPKTALPYLELANKSSDMGEVKQVRELLRRGYAHETVFDNYGIDLTGKANPIEEEMPLHKKFTDVIQSKPRVAPQPQEDISHLQRQETRPLSVASLQAG